MLPRYRSAIAPTVDGGSGVVTLLRQLQELTALFGGYDFARYVHFAAMAAIVGFLVVHVTLALLVPKSLRAMIAGS